MPVRVKDYYCILEVPAGATAIQIRRAYLKLARKYHPDLNPANRVAEEKFKELQEAYKVLSDPGRRRQYDDQIRPQVGPQQRRRPRPSSRATGHPPSPPKQGFGELIQSIFGIRPARKSGGAGPRDDKTRPQAQLVLSLEDANRGGVHKIAVLERRRCPICRGQKEIDGRACQACRGSGRLHTPVNMDVNIPPGARNGSLVKVVVRDGIQGR